MITVFFPGKFQPPHIGHVMTISKLINNYEKVIIGITEDKPRIVSREEIQTIYETIFGKKVEYRFIDGVLTDYKTTEGLPKFDILISGNSDVIEWGLKLGIAVKSMPRSKGIGCSGSEVRELLELK